MTKRFGVAHFCAFATLVCLVGLSVYGQTITTGDLTGTITDATSAVVPSATVTLKSTDTGEVRTVQTNNNGVYHFIFVKPGNYTISATSAGLTSDTTKVVVEVGQAVTLDLVAKVQSVGQVIEVNEKHRVD